MDDTCEKSNHVVYLKCLMLHLPIKQALGFC